MKNEERLHKEYEWHGHTIIVDACEHPAKPDWYEVMAMYEDGLDIESCDAETYEDAKQIFRSMLRKYPEGEKPLTGKWAKLRDDLIIALAAGRTAEKDCFAREGWDGGTCNLDCAWIKFPPRTRTALVEQAAREAGTNCFRWGYKNQNFVFTPDTRAQGNPRAENAEAMAKALRELGYDAGEYCQMD